MHTSSSTPFRPQRSCLTPDKCTLVTLQLLLLLLLLLHIRRPDMKLYSAYMLKPVSTNVPAGDAYMTLLPNYKGKTNMATLFRTIQEDIFDEQLNFVGIQVSTAVGTSAAGREQE